MDKGGAFISKEYKDFCKSKKNRDQIEHTEITYRHRTVEGEIQTLKNSIFATMEDNLCLTECVNRENYVRRFKRHTGLKITPFEFHHCRKLRTEPINKIIPF